MNNSVQKLKKAHLSYRKGDLSKARKLLNTLLKRDPNDLNALQLLGKIELKNTDYKNAIIAFSKALALSSDNAGIHYNIACAYLGDTKYNEALNHLNKTVEIDPSNFEAWNKICGLTGQFGMFEESIHAGEHAINLNSNSFLAYMNLGAAYDAYSMTSKARECYEKAHELANDDAMIKCKLADALICSGDKSSAEKHYRDAISLKINYTHPYRQISRLKSYDSIDHPDFRNITNLLDNNAIAEPDRSHLHFALGKMYEDCGLYDKSFEHLNIANELENKRSNFDTAKFTKFISEIISVFNKKMISEMAEMGSDSELPIFITGMPRSGSTLIEQIIASHPDAYGAGELYWFGQAEYKIKSELKTIKPYPACCVDLDEKSISGVADNYLRYLSLLTDNGSYKKITDKFLGSFIHLGLIALMFPNSKIIHCKRNPLDTCFSIFSILFPGNVDFGHSLENIGVVYSQYIRLMKHWADVLPNRIMTINYEDLISHQEHCSRSIIDYIGLNWDDRCLRFYKNKNQVSTISAFQVRDEIHNKSIGRWNNYASHLSPLIKALKENNVIINDEQ